MVKAKDLLGRLDSYLADNYGYGKGSLLSGNNGLEIAGVGITLETPGDDSKVVFYVDNDKAVRGLDKKVLEIEDGSFWSKNLPEGASEKARKALRFLTDFSICREDDRYVFSGMLDTDDLDKAVNAIFHGFVRPTLFCLRD